MNIIFLQHKKLASAALRCGASNFGFRDCGSFSKYPSQFVAVFKSVERKRKFSEVLHKLGLEFQNDFYSKAVFHKGEYVHLVFVTSYLIIPKQKLFFKTFRQFCKSGLIQFYKSPTLHPNQN